MGDVTEVTQLVLRERQSRDRGWWTRMEQCFHPESVVTVSWYQGDGAGFVAGSKTSFDRGIRPVHRLSPPVVDVRGDRGVVELPAAIEFRSVVDGVDTDQVSFTRLIYRVVRSTEGWKVSTFDCIYERDTLAPVVSGTPLCLDPARLAQFRQPYRYLAYILSIGGKSIGENLYGDDQPERVNALYAQAFAWLDA